MTLSHLPDLSAAPCPSSCRLSRCVIEECEAMCCYDGVYFMNDAEEEAIRFVVREFPEAFRDLPQKWVVDGYWQGQLFGRKTLAVPHSYKNPDYPSHFTQTRCVFAEDNGYCRLESLARAQNLHPWTYKPSTCWIHPADDTGDGLEPPPLSPAEDPFQSGPEYPGYSSFTSCGRNCGAEQGLPWKKALQSERDYYELMKDVENYGKTVDALKPIIAQVKDKSTR